MAVFDQASLAQRLQLIREDEAKDVPELRDHLNEKGVECGILIPIMEILLDFDAVKDIRYEAGSKTRNQRFDFLIENKFLLESKKLGTQLRDMHKQIEDYIIHNVDINYGLLTNGFDFTFFLQKPYIQSFLTGSDELRVPIKKEVLSVFTLSIDEEKFVDIMKLFSKSTYVYHFERIAQYVLACYNQGKMSRITEDNNLNELLKCKIRETVDVRTGCYLNSIKKGELKVGNKLRFSDDAIEVTVEVLDDGRVKLHKGDAKIQLFDLVKNGAFKPIIPLLIGEWDQKDQIFDNPLDIIRAAQNKRKLHNQQLYNFTKVTN